ncbi:hypothetical protein K435DRAFT_782507 [Dendrothele bispora CBS 962.96]|uniref:Uncharacterized protein n=1 Tax=Dendrothele bispora (strain CBS 962.96) TaxID=1314807 RepID=A0A4S8LET1_DENBC|nr:hypothetical protein K435DRAFT_782507 [Dendrothele bispora CBS 962.96]
MIAYVNAAAVQKRADVDVTSLSGPQVLTATRVFPSIIDAEPFMVSVTSEIVWTQFPTQTSSSSA